MKNKTIKKGTIFLESGHVVYFKYYQKSGKVICTINDDTYLSPIKLVCKCYDEHPGKSIPESICEDMEEFVKYFENSSRYSRKCSDFEEKQN